jgi:DNA-binding winged helix-turn-helix (wHTH) protein
VLRYRFSDFTLSTRRRLLIRNGRQLPLIPRYFDLLIFLIERRRDAVHRREIFDRVWSDVIVSDSALSQAIRTLRRTLGDDPREPSFIRTVSRHGYQFTCPDVIEELDEDVPEPVPVPTPATTPAYAPEVQTEQRRQKLGALMNALLTGATRAAAGSALSGIAAGLAGGILLNVAPDSSAPIAVIPVLALVGAMAGACGGLGVGAGLAVAESSSRLRTALGLASGAALGGAVIGQIVEWLMRSSLAALMGLALPVGGGLEGFVIGAMAGIGYAVARRLDATAQSPLYGAVVVALCCAAAAVALSWTGRPLVGGTLHLIAREIQGAQVSLTPLGRLVGEPDFGPAAQALIAGWEGSLFGFGVGVGLLRRSAGLRSGVAVQHISRA